MMAVVAHAPGKPANLTVVIKWQSREHADEFIEASKARIAASSGGKVPEFQFLDEIAVEQ